MAFEYVICTTSWLFPFQYILLLPVLMNEELKMQTVIFLAHVALGVALKLFSFIFQFNFESNIICTLLFGIAMTTEISHNFHFPVYFCF